MNVAIKKKKKQRDKHSNSLKKKSKKSKRPSSIRDRPNSAKKFDEFFNDIHCIPPPPPPLADNSNLSEGLTVNPMNIKQTQLRLHKSYTSLPSNHLKLQQQHCHIRKQKSHGDEKNELHEFTHNLNTNDPAVQKLKRLQSKIKKTASRSDDLEQLLIATPPSLPPTPKLRI